MTCSGIWIIVNSTSSGIIAKYQVQVMLLLNFVYQRSREIFGNTQETFISLWLKKQTKASAFVAIFLSQ